MLCCRLGWTLWQPESLLQIGPFVPVPKGYLSRFWNRDKAAGTKALESFVPGGRTGTKCPSR